MRSGASRSAFCSAAVVGDRVDADLALVDDALLVLEQVLDRVLDRQDVAGLRLVAVVDHRGQRRRLARAGRARDQHQPALLDDEVEQHRRQLQLLERRHVAAHVADDERDRAALAEDVDAEVAHAAVEVREVHLHRVLELARLLLVHELVGDPPHGVHVHRLRGHRLHDAVDLDVDRRAAGDEKVRGLLLGHQLEQPIEIHGAPFVVGTSPPAGGAGLYNRTGVGIHAAT